MNRIPGYDNWRIRYRIMKENTAVEILRAVTCERSASLPERLPARPQEWLPVVSLAGHALSGDPWDTGDVANALEVELTDGRPLPAEAEWSNRGIEELRLPAHIREVGDYAFLNCRNMRRLEMEDSSVDWRRSCFMNCRALREIVLRRDRMEEDAGNLAYFVGETTGELDVIIRAEHGGPAEHGEAAQSEARLIFPDYVELYTENNEARQFDYTIEGAGYPYRHVFRNRKLNWHDYDSLWRAYLGRETDRARAARMAWYRVSRPVGLGSEQRREYEFFVREHFSELAEHILSAGDSAELAHLVRIAAPDKALLAAAAAVARRLGRTDCLAVLMEEEHRQAPAPVGRRKTYEL